MLPLFISYILFFTGNLKTIYVFCNFFRKLLVNTRKKLKTTGMNRTPGGTPIIITSHDSTLKQTNNITLHENN